MCPASRTRTHIVRDWNSNKEKQDCHKPACPSDIEEIDDELVHDGGGILGEVEGGSEQGPIEPQKNRPKQVILDHLGST